MSDAQVQIKRIDTETLRFTVAAGDLLVEGITTTPELGTLGFLRLEGRGVTLDLLIEDLAAAERLLVAVSSVGHRMRTLPLGRRADAAAAGELQAVSDV